MSTQWISVIVKRKGNPDAGGLLDQLRPPFPASEGAIVNVKGKNYRVVKIGGNLEFGPGELEVTED